MTTAPVKPSGPVTDFPAPVLDANAPPNSATLFGPPTQGAASGGPCLLEPEDNVLFPQNWLRPRFRWTAANGETVFELRLHAANQLSDLVVYTTNTAWTMPKPMWDALRTHSPTEAMTVGIRGAVLAGGTLQNEAAGTQTTMGIAPVQATGTIVYWTTHSTTGAASVLKGFSAGDETVAPVLDPMQYSQAQQATSSCVGCHTSTPDGEFVAFTTTTPDQAKWQDGLGLVDPNKGAVGSVPSYVTPSGAQALSRWNEGAVAFSSAHWSPGDHKAVVSYDNSNTRDIVLSWVDLEAPDPTTASGTIARNGDSLLAGAPTWSHDGKTIVYVSTNRICTGRLGNCTPAYHALQDMGSTAALYAVPYAAGAGGAATPVNGAADPAFQEYYPTFSSDDQWIVFNRIAKDYNLYDQPTAEVYVVPAAGGTATRLAANDPPKCSGQTSPGVTNSWGKWAPTALQANGNTYYWIVFSSKRTLAAGIVGGVDHTPQLYLTAMVIDAKGQSSTYGSIYLWNQPPAEANHTPAWDTFRVPPIPPPK
jgi:mono/diheme cytochrome c family protein